MPSTFLLLYMGIYKKPRPFNHIFGGDRILRAWYRGIKNAGPRKRAQGRAQDTPYITSYITMEFGGYLLNVARKPTRARARKGEAQGVLSYQKVRGIFDNPHILTSLYPRSFLSALLVMDQQHHHRHRHLLVVMMVRMCGEHLVTGEWWRKVTK